MASTLTPTSQPQLLICTCIGSPALATPLIQVLKGDRYDVIPSVEVSTFLQVVEHQRHDIDCLILEQTPELPEVLLQLHRRATLLPAVIIQAADTGGQQPANTPVPPPECSYHTAEVWISPAELPRIPQILGQAISQFLRLSPACRLPTSPDYPTQDQNSDEWLASLNAQQRRLSDKLRERLGYLGVYYKRSPQEFLRNLPDSEKQPFLNSLKSDYQEIILDYFRKDNSVNPKIDTFVTRVFFADVSVSQVLEIHMELMDIFAKKLKLEGRNEDILLDYRLVLIDTVAHLCEMYRRSIPRDE